MATFCGPYSTYRTSRRLHYARVQEELHTEAICRYLLLFANLDPGQAAFQDSVFSPPFFSLFFCFAGPLLLSPSLTHSLTRSLLPRLHQPAEKPSSFSSLLTFQIRVHVSRMVNPGYWVSCPNWPTFAAGEFIRLNLVNDTSNPAYFFVVVFTSKFPPPLPSSDFFLPFPSLPFPVKLILSSAGRCPPFLGQNAL